MFDYYNGMPMFKRLEFIANTRIETPKADPRESELFGENPIPANAQWDYDRCFIEFD